MRGLLLIVVALGLQAPATAQESAPTYSMQQENGIRVWGGCAANVSVARTFVLTARPGKQLTCSGLQTGCDTLPETANEVYRGKAWRQPGTAEADWSCWPSGTTPQGADFIPAGDCVVCQRCGPWCTNSVEPTTSAPYPVCAPGYVPPSQIVPRMSFDDALRPLFGVNPGNATLTGDAFVRYGSSDCFDAAAGTPTEERNRRLFRRLYAGQVYHLVQSGTGLEHLAEGTALAERCWPTSPTLPPELAGIAQFEAVGPCAVCTAYYPNDPALPPS